MSFEPYKIAHGVSGLVYRTSLARVTKCAWTGRVHEIEHERNVLQHLGQHPLIIKNFTVQHKAQISLEYHPFNLREIINSGDEVLWRKWAFQITEGVIYLHSKNVIHRDLSPRNILVTAERNIVLCDFAGSSLDGKWLAECRGEIRFTRPSDRKTTTQDDIFALGCVFYEILTGRPPYTDKEDCEVGSLYEEGIFPPVNQLPIGDIITKCWVGRYNHISEVLVDLV